MRLSGQLTIVPILAATIFTFPTIASAQASTKTFEYDALGRLVRVEASGGKENDTRRDYKYDAAGNRLSVNSTKDADGDGVNEQNNAGKTRIMFNGRFIVQPKR